MRTRPRQHYRRLKSGKVTIVNKSVLGRQKRAKGLRFEHRILSKLKRQYPKTTFRSSGSHSIIDVLVREPDKYRIITARTSGYLSPKEREELAVFDKPYEQVELWYKPSKKTIKKEYIKRAKYGAFVKGKWPEMDPMIAEKLYFVRKEQKKSPEKFREEVKKIVEAREKMLLYEKERQKMRKAARYFKELGITQ